MPSPRVAPDLRAARRAVTLVFFANGALFAGWLPRIPAVKAELGLSDGQLGLTLVGTGLGAVLGGLLAAALVDRLGSRRAVLASTSLLAAALPLVGLAPTAVVVALVLAVAGAADAVMDVAMNASGVLVESRARRSVLHAMHGWWSLGAVAGGLVAAAAAAGGVPVAVQLAADSALLAAGVLAVRSALLPDAPHASAPAAGQRPSLRMLVRTVGLLGVLTLLAAVLEDSPASWGAVHLTQDLGAGPGVAGLGFVAFTAAMTIGRLLSDRLVDRVGAARVVRTGALLVAVTLPAALQAARVGGAAGQALAVAGFAAVGLGVCALFPAAFSAAGSEPGVPSGAGIALVSLVARGGFLLAPLFVGGLATLLDLRTALCAVALPALAVALLAGTLTRSNRPPVPAAGPGPR